MGRFGVLLLCAAWAVACGCDVPFGADEPAEPASPSGSGRASPPVAQRPRNDAGLYPVPPASEPDHGKKAAGTRAARAPAEPAISSMPTPDTGVDIHNLLMSAGFRFAPDMEAPTLAIRPSEGPRENLQFGELSYSKRRARLLELARNPDMAAEPLLIQIAGNTEDPLTPYALMALAALHSPDAIDAIRAATDDPRPNTRAHALAVLLESRADPDVGAMCLRHFVPEEDAWVRTVAAVGLGIHRVTAAIPALRSALQTDFDNVRLTAGWALWRCGEDDGRKFLEAIALGDDPNVSPRALFLLSVEADPRTVPVVWKCLASRRDAVWGAAYAVCLTLPDTMLRATATVPELPEKPTDEQCRIAARKALVCMGRLWGEYLGIGTKTNPGRDVWVGLCRLSEIGSRRDLELITERMRAWDDPRSFEPLFRVLASPVDEVRTLACAALGEKARQRGLSGMPQAPMRDPWRRWWIQSSTIMERPSGIETLVFLRTPDGLMHYPVAGTDMLPGVRVRSVRIRTSTEAANVILEVGGERLTLFENTAANTP